MCCQNNFRFLTSKVLSHWKDGAQFFQKFFAHLMFCQLMSVKATAYDSYDFHTLQAIQGALMNFGWGQHHPGMVHFHQDRTVS